MSCVHAESNRATQFHYQKQSVRVYRHVHLVITNVEPGVAFVIERAPIQQAFTIWH